MINILRSYKQENLRRGQHGSLLVENSAFNTNQQIQNSTWAPVNIGRQRTVQF